MVEKRRSRRIDVNFQGSVYLRATKKKVRCFIRDINENCAGVLITSIDPRICAKGAIELTIFIPAERAPVKVAGMIVWHSEENKDVQNKSSYLAGISITHINLNDRRKLEHIIKQNRMSFGQSFRTSNNSRNSIFG